MACSIFPEGLKALKVAAKSQQTQKKVYPSLTKNSDPEKYSDRYLTKYSDPEKYADTSITEDSNPETHILLLQRLLT